MTDSFKYATDYYYNMYWQDLTNILNVYIGFTIVFNIVKLIVDIIKHVTELSVIVW